MRVPPLVGLLLVTGLWASDAAAQTYLVLVGGIGGEPKYRELFHGWSMALVEAAGDRFELSAGRIIFLAESPERHPSITGRSTKESIERSLNDLANRAESDAEIFIVLIGHGSTVGGTPRFNLPGPDITAEEFDLILARFPTQQIVFANLSSASGGFIQVLSGDRRTIVTATKSGYERNETIFPGHFVDAFASDGADVDKDERVSVLEAFNYARREVARAYDQQNRLLTEHALLDDNGDGRGSTVPDPETADGARAMELFLDRPDLRAIAGVSDSSELAALYKEKQNLEREIVALRGKKDELATEVYERELERLLLELARTNRTIREHEEKEPR